MLPLRKNNNNNNRILNFLYRLIDDIINFWNYLEDTFFFFFLH